MFKVVANASHSDRGAAGKVGRIARCSVHGEVWWDDGAAWQPVRDLTQPRGIQGLIQHGSSNADVAAGTEVVITDSVGQASIVTFTADVNRLYRVEWNVGVVDGQTGIVTSPSVQETATLQLRYASGTRTPTAADGSIGACRLPVFSGSSSWDESTTVVGWLNGVFPGQYTVGGLLGNDGHVAGSGVRLLALSTPMTLTVTDVGPSQ